jgi:pimeloyl-ACP methyl ester carboxylesterase
LGANLAFWNLYIVPRLAQWFRTTSYDLRGHGLSDAPASGYGLEDLVSDLACLFDHLQLNCAHVVGHSFGAAVALEFALAYPSRVRSLLLCDAVIPALHGLSRLVRRNRWSALGVSGQEARNQPHSDAPWLDYLFDALWANQQVPAGFGPLARPFRMWGGNGSRAEKRWRELLENTTALTELASKLPFSRHRLRNLDRPCLALYGELSRFRPIGRYLARWMPNCRLELIPAAGHFFPLAMPEICLRHLDRFLKANSTTAP